MLFGGAAAPTEYGASLLVPGHARLSVMEPGEFALRVREILAGLHPPTTSRLLDGPPRAGFPGLGQPRRRQTEGYGQE